MFIKITLAALTVGLSSIALASPASFLKQIKKDSGEWRSSVTRSQQEHVTQCANFTGHWVGTCTDNEGEVEERELKISQEGCYNMDFEGFGMPIGGTLSMALSPHPYSEDAFGYSASIASQWNDSQTRLHQLFSGTILNGFGFISTSEMWLQGDQLRRRDIENKVLMIDNSTPVTFDQEDCTYTKN